MASKKGKGMAIIISIMDKKDLKKMKKKKAEMAYGGMSGGKKHMYSAGGSVTDNPGLKALKASGPKGMEAYNKITGN
tara:strand:+ start:856 stop:1086 length:231 start_codon:yes stop_codon:yes gene_type:complete